MTFTQKQAAVIALLRANPGGLTVAEIGWRTNELAGETRARLHALKRHGLVTNDGQRPARWRMRLVMDYLEAPA